MIVSTSSLLSSSSSSWMVIEFCCCGTEFGVATMGLGGLEGGVAGERAKGAAGGDVRSTIPRSLRVAKQKVRVGSRVGE